MTAIRGYECDLCLLLQNATRRTLTRQYGWRFAAQTAPGPLHYCNQCAIDMGLSTTKRRPRLMATSKLLLVAVLALPLLPATAEAHGGRRGCGKYHGEAYIICAETGGQARYRVDRAPHPGPSSASGAYGLLSSTRRIWGKGCRTDRCVALRYVADRYGGSWERAEAQHRSRRFW